jgi:PASTA domain
MNDELAGDIRRFLYRIDDAAPSAPSVADVALRLHRAPRRSPARGPALALAAVASVAAFAAIRLSRHDPISTAPVSTEPTTSIAEPVAGCNAAGTSVVMPNVLARTLAEAKAELAALCRGFLVEAVEVSIDGARPGIVMQQSVAPGSVLRPGDTAALSVNAETAKPPADGQNDTMPLRVVGVVTLADGNQYGIGLNALAFCLTDGVGTNPGCDSRAATLSPVFVNAAGSGDDNKQLIYGVVDPGLTVKLASNGAPVDVVQTTEPIDGELVFMALLPQGTTLSVDVIDASGTVVKHIDDAPH